MPGLINGLEERIEALQGVEKTISADGKTMSFKVGSQVLISDVTANQLVLHINQSCVDKIVGALKSEQRVKKLDLDKLQVTFSFSDDVDREFVFLYVRFAWKHWRTRQDAAA